MIERAQGPHMMPSIDGSSRQPGIESNEQSSSQTVTTVEGTIAYNVGMGAETPA
eukprot:COSAG01_NODE_493_length_16327_cov_5.632879_12_plen_54_part_00